MVGKSVRGWLREPRTHHDFTQDREQAIRETAYYIAEKRDFKGGPPADDWALAEKALEKDRHTV